MMIGSIECSPPRIWLEGSKTLRHKRVARLLGAGPQFFCTAFLPSLLHLPHKLPNVLVLALGGYLSRDRTRAPTHMTSFYAARLPGWARYC
jgi:hypothetical protein